MNYFELFKQMALSAVSAKLEYWPRDDTWFCAVYRPDGVFVARRKSPELAIGEVYQR